MEGIPLNVGDWIVTTEGEVGRVKLVEGDHVTITLPTSKGPEDRKVAPNSIHKVGR